MSLEVLPGVVNIDHKSSTPGKPYGIITADCSSPRELDDGIFVEQIPNVKEAYRVGVCVVDASKLYTDPDILAYAMKVTEAKYWPLPNGEKGYDPMIDSDLIKQFEFTAPNVRDALIVSFTVGKETPLSDIDISFGKVEVRRNDSYRDFWKRCATDGPDKKFIRASALIIRHLQYTSGGDYDYEPGQSFGQIYDRLVSGRYGHWLKGSRINESFMVAANFLVGKTLAEEQRPAIYRVHDPTDETHLELVPPNVARYSRTPGQHQGLNLDVYCRVTSPLRRLEDYVMSYQLKQRSLGRAATVKDVHDVARSVLALNRRVVQQAAEDPTRLSRKDTLGRNFRLLSAVPEEDDDGVVVPLQGRLIAETA